ncbi:Cof-type HAD-IIB family hydrolase [Paenibacillus sp. H1-7]|uniref:HAD family hydrolase n=1 Tax=Paenibacillus sp. H1-7 TaxID=2282849 RepID=UPI001EF7A11B|nr:Cof-type HAD-IIB family hydrolase [Paenibacillus sp. H1-7]
MAYKLIALDMDGTLLNKEKQISEQNQKWIQSAMEAGIHVTLATGRPFRDAVVYARQLNLQSPLIINNGSEVWSLPETLHTRCELDPQLVNRILSELLTEYGEKVDFWAHTVEQRIDRSNVPENTASLRWLQFAVRSSDAVVLAEIRSTLESWNAFEISNSHITNIECNALGVSKASGLLEACNRLGIDMSEVIAVGDSLNDIPMIRAAGLGVAMGNAQEEVKLAADVIAPSNHEDGVAHIIQSYI